MITAIDTNTALILIDLQNGVVAGEKAHPVHDILTNAASLVSAFRKKDLAVVIVNVNPVGAAWTKARTEVSAVPKRPVAEGGAKPAMPTPGFADIVPEINKLPSDIYITKKTWNAFFNTALHGELQKRNITQIILAGISTSIGIEGTARAASELGYNISFAIDAMTDRVEAAHNNSLQYIFPRIGELGNTAHIIALLASA